MRRDLIPFALVLIFLTGCASQRGVDFDESARLMGRESDVRIDAQISTIEVGIGSNLSLTYEIENLRENSIAIADIVPEVTYDNETGVVTILLGSEVPGNEFLPRLELIRSGERKTFQRGANLNVGSTARTHPRSIRVRLSYLKNVEPFESLVGISEKAVYDPDLANELFLPWVENVQFVITNEVPLNWTRRPTNSPVSAEASGRIVKRPQAPGSPH